MPSIPQRYRYVIALLSTPLIVVGMVAWALRPMEWRSHLWNLFGRAFKSLTAYYGTNGPGFLVSVIVSTLFAAIFTVVLMGLFKGWEAMQRHLIETLLVAVLCVAGELAIVWGPLYLRHLASVTYDDHRGLASAAIRIHSTDKHTSDTNNANLSGQISQLQGQLAATTSELNSRRNNIFVDDPAFDNIARLLQDFQMYRSALSSKPCVIYVTAPSDSMALAGAVARLSNTVSGCFTFGPGGGRENPDLDEMTKDGMVPNVIVVDTQRGNRAGLALQEHLAAQIQTQLSYEPPKIPKDQLYAGSCCGYTEDFVWLQFGPGVKWNTERLPKTK